MSKEYKRALEILKSGEYIEYSITVTHEAIYASINKNFTEEDALAFELLPYDLDTNYIIYTHPLIYVNIPLTREQYKNLKKEYSKLLKK